MSFIAIFLTKNYEITHLLREGFEAVVLRLVIQAKHNLKTILK